MFEFLSDPTNQFIIIVALTILAIIGPIIVYLKQRMRKSIHYRIVSRTALFSVKEEVKKELEITYKGKKIEDAQLVLIEISNTGNVPIEAEDYKKPISFNFGEEAQVLTAEVIKTDPEELQASVSIDKGIVSLTPILTNAGDSLTLKIIVSGLGEVTKASSRIIGVKQLEEAKPPMNLGLWLLMLLTILSYGCMFLFFLIASSNPILAIIFMAVSIVGLVTGSVLALALLVQRLLRRMRQKNSE